MVQKLLKVLSFLTVAVLAISCEQDNIISTAPNAKRITITTDRDDDKNDSKASLDGITFSWNSGDKLGVFNSNTINAEFTTAEDGQIAEFTGIVTPVNGESIYAVHPYRPDATMEEDKYRFELPILQEQTHTEGVINPSSIGNYLFSFGQSPKTWSDADHINLKMDHLMTVFDIELSGIPTGTELSKLVLTTAGDNGFASQATVSFMQAADYIPNYELSATKSNLIEVALVDAKVSSGKPFVVRVAVFPYAFSGSTVWNVSIEGSAGTWKGVKSFTSSVTTNPGAKHTVEFDVQKYESVSPIFHFNDRSCSIRAEKHSISVHLLKHLKKGDFDITYETASFAKASQSQVGSYFMYSIDIEKNDTGKDRTTRVTFTKKDGSISDVLTITQVAIDKVVATCSVTSIDNKAQSITIDVDANVPWDAVQDKSWGLIIVPPNTSPYTIEKSLTINIPANDCSPRIIAINFAPSESNNQLSRIEIRQAGVEPVSGAYRMPIVFHMLHSTGDKPVASEAQMQNLIHRTNRLVNQGEGLKIYFELAKDDETGELLEENGVNMIDMGPGGNSIFDAYAVIGNRFEDANSITLPIKLEYYNVHKYINVFIFQFSEYLGGLGNYPYVSKSKPLIGMVEGEYYLQYEMNRPHGLCLNTMWGGFTPETLTHELGHYFGLKHTFYYDSHSAEEQRLNDYCDDTYTYNRDEYDQKNGYQRYDNFKDVCFEAENIMDYNKNRNLEFTKDQKDRMEHIIKYGICVPNYYQNKTRSIYNGSRKPPLIQIAD